VKYSTAKGDAVFSSAKDQDRTQRPVKNGLKQSVRLCTYLFVLKSMLISHAASVTIAHHCTMFCSIWFLLYHCTQLLTASIRSSHCTLLVTWSFVTKYHVNCHLNHHDNGKLLNKYGTNIFVCNSACPSLYCSCHNLIIVIF
jgi:hypothetical protein